MKKPDFLKPIDYVVLGLLIGTSIFCLYKLITL